MIPSWPSANESSCSRSGDNPPPSFPQTEVGSCGIIVEAADLQLEVEAHLSAGETLGEIAGEVVVAPAAPPRPSGANLALGVQT